MLSEPLPASVHERPAANKEGLQPTLSPLHPTLPVPCTAFSVDEACGVTSTTNQHCLGCVYRG